MKKLCFLWCYALFYVLTLGSYHSAYAQSNQWTWMAGSSSPNNPSNYAPAYITPSGRWASATWTDANGNRWLFGGLGTPVGNTNGYMSDLWKYDVTTNNWTWVSGSGNADVLPVYGVQGVAAPTNTPGGRRFSVSWLDASGNLWLFGGNNANGYLNDLWKYNIASGNWTWMKGSTTNDQPGVYGTQGTAAITNTPGARSSAVGWADASGNLWVFSGYGKVGTNNGNLNDLWKYNIASGNWTWMKGNAAVEPGGVYGTQGTAAAANTPRGRQISTAWTDLSGNFWLFGGTCSSSGQLNDLWKYTPASGNWTWMKGSSGGNAVATYGTQGIAAATNTPSGRYGGTQWVDGNGDLWMLGGAGVAANSDVGSLNDLWKYNIATGNWTWMKGGNAVYTKGTYGVQGVAAATNLPGARESGNTWLDASGNLILFGGLGYGAGVSSGLMNDVWKYDRTTGNWTWLRGSTTADAAGTANAPGTGTVASIPGARRGSSTWTDASGNLWLFGGSGYTVTGSAYLGDMWKYTVSTGSWTWVAGSSGQNSAGIYGTRGVAATGNVPGARQNSVSWKDNNGNLWLLGGYGYGSDNYSAGYLNDLWKYDITTGVWTWMKGEDYSGVPGQYGTQGTTASYTYPGARSGGTTWTDASGNLWLYGGMGFGAYGAAGFLSDLWKYDITTGSWTWMKGPNLTGQLATYGTMGAAATANRPGARNFANSWTDNTGNLWLFGGNGFATNSYGWLNDLWKYDITSGNWTWVEGGSAPNLYGVYGTQNIAAVENTPGARAQATAWKDSAGSLWLYGGNGYGSVAGGYLNDIWKYNITTGNWTWIKGSVAPFQMGVYGTLGVTGNTLFPGARIDNLLWADNKGTVWTMGGDGYTASTNGTLGDLWKYVYCNSYSLPLPATGQTLAASSNNVLATGALSVLENNCLVSGTVLPNGNLPVGGATTGKSWVETSVPSGAGNLYTRRHYEIVPALNASTATGRITLYASQADFDNFNQTATNKLPASPTDMDGIGRLRLFRYSGASSDGSGLPASYTGNPTELFVGPANIVWNSSSNWWEISLNTTGFGGFFIGTSPLVILPVGVAGFTVAKQAGTSVLTWKTVQEGNGGKYVVERSSNDRDFIAIGSVAVASGTLVHNYSFTDANPLNGANYYRLKLVETDGKVSYSEIRLLNYGAAISIALYPNPATDKVSVTGAEPGMTIRLLDGIGRMLQVHTAKSTTESINLNALAKGFYTVQVYGTNGALLNSTPFVKE